jgi:hydrogenase nickel incorporation protein HypB
MERIAVTSPVLKRNDELACANRALFSARGIVTVNLMSAPGAGKTTLLERTLPLLQSCLRCAVIEGDLQTALDAERVRKTGVAAHQINTSSCHLDAKLVREAFDSAFTDPLDLLFIENIGNLVCPAAYDLGERWRVTLFSVTEGADKPRKYPKMFYRSHGVVLNKIDLLPYTDVNLEDLAGSVRAVSPEAKVLPLSCRSGEGLNDWVDWLLARVEESRAEWPAWIVQKEPRDVSRCTR